MKQLKQAQHFEQTEQPKEAKHLKYSEPEKQEEEAMQTKEPKLINQGLGKTVQDQEPLIGS